MAKTFKPCSVVGCNGNAHKSAHGYRGWCSPHYQRWRKYGDPLGGGTMRGEPFHWLETVAVPFDGDACLTWPYATDRNGYGSMRINGRHQVASRALCEIVHGPPPTPEHESAHSCGNGSAGCVNPKHLRWATRSENMADRVAHGSHARGEKNTQSKLTEQDVRQIRRLAKAGFEQRDIAKKYGIARSNCHYIIHRKKWAWLD